VVDEQIAGNRQQPRASRRATGIEAFPGPERALECLLGQVLGVIAARQPVGKEPVDA
jgi:hypothetical protein